MAPKRNGPHQPGTPLSLLCSEIIAVKCIFNKFANLRVFNYFYKMQFHVSNKKHIFVWVDSSYKYNSMINNDIVLFVFFMNHSHLFTILVVVESSMKV